MAKLHGAEHPASIELVAALEGALVSRRIAGGRRPCSMCMCRCSCMGQLKLASDRKPHLDPSQAACLTAARECDRPNAQACSSIWYRCQLQAVHELAAQLLAALPPVQCNAHAQQTSTAAAPPTTMPGCPPLLPLHLRSWGRIAGGAPEGYVPSPAAAELLWERTLRLSLAFDSQGAANMLVRLA